MTVEKTSPTKAYDPTEGYSAREKVVHWTERAGWCVQTREYATGLISHREVKEAEEIIPKLREAMRADSGVIHVSAMTALQRLYAMVEMYRVQEISKRDVVDGDGDGFVYDGTPRKRPATPAERAAGARLRAKKAAGAPRKAAAAKKGAAAPKNDYDKRVAKFERAINQAIKSGDKKQIKQVHDLIGQDFILKKPDRDRLQQVLAARRDGKPGPALPKAPAAAKKAPAKKAPAKKAPAKKVAAPKPESKTERNGVQVGRKTADSIDRLDAADKKMAENKAAVAAAKTPVSRKKVPARPAPKRFSTPPKYAPRIRDAKTPEELDQIAADVDAAAMPKVDKDHYKKVIARKKQEMLERRIAPHTAAPAGLPKPSPQGELQRRMAAAAEARRQKSFERRSAKKVAAKKVAAKPIRRQPTIETVETTHGPKTRAWMRHAEKDIKAARDFRTLKGRITQISNARAAGRISDREANHLRQMVYDRLDQLGLDRNGNRKQPTWRQRIAEAVAPKKKTTFGNLLADGPETEAYKALGNAQTAADVDVAIQQAAAAGDRGALSVGKVQEIMREGFRVKRRLADNKAKDASFQRKAMENAQIKVERAIDEAQGNTDLTAVQRQMQAPQNKDFRDFLRANPDKMQRLNEKFKAKKDAIKNGTIQPKMPPGAARAKAKANLPSDWAQKIEAAAKVTDVEKLMSDLEKIPVSAISKDDFNKIAEALNERMAELDAAGANFNDEPFEKILGGKADGRGKRAADLLAIAYDPSQVNAILRVFERTEKDKNNVAIVRDMANIRMQEIEARILAAAHPKLGGYGMPSRSEAGVDNSAEALLALDSHFKGGGKIEDAPSSGLWNYLQTSNRFTVKAKSGVAGITPKFTITDNETGEKWWAKADWTSMAVVEHGALKERWGGMLMEGMGINAPKVRLGQNGEVNDDPGVGKFMLVQDAGEAIFGQKGMGVQDGFYSPVQMDAVQKGRGAGGYARLHLLDYIMDNNDRHGGNVMGVIGPDGPEVALLDFGLGMGYWRHKVDKDLSPIGYLGNKSRRDNVGDAILRDPNSAKHMAKVQAELRKVRVAAIVDAMINAGQDPEQAKLWGESMQNRIDKLLAMTPEQLVQTFSRN